MKHIKTFGVIGGGEFGGVAASRLAPEETQVLGFDIRPEASFPEHVERVGFSDIKEADALVLAVPFNSLTDLAPKLEEECNPETLIVDVCSVKIKPTKLFANEGMLNRPNVLMTHPLFGPQTLKDGVAGKSLVVTKSHGQRTEELLTDWQERGINVVSMNPEEHDKEMAHLHALTFFVGRSLVEMEIPDHKLTTGYFSILEQLIKVERHHSRELFDTIQRHNPFAAEIRDKFISILLRLDQEVSE